MAATRFQTWLAELPQGSFKMFFACMAGLLVILAVILAPIAEALLCWARWHWSPGSLSSIQPDGSRVLAGTCSHLEVPEGALWAIFAFLAAIGGFSSWDFKTKRDTYVPSPPGSQDVEDTKAGVVPKAPPAGVAFDPVVMGAAAGAAAEVVRAGRPEKYGRGDYGEQFGPTILPGESASRSSTHTMETS